MSARPDSPTNGVHTLRSAQRAEFAGAESVPGARTPSVLRCALRPG